MTKQLLYKNNIDQNIEDKHYINEIIDTLYLNKEN